MTHDKDCQMFKCSEVLAKSNFEGWENGCGFCSCTCQTMTENKPCCENPFVPPYPHNHTPAEPKECDWCEPGSHKDFPTPPPQKDDWREELEAVARGAWGKTKKAWQDVDVEIRTVISVILAQKEKETKELKSQWQAEARREIREKIEGSGEWRKSAYSALKHRIEKIFDSLKSEQ